ncbi:hypothetical protein K8I61_01310 [bacterium]|nr:hypothetical protein [bacterium]
MLTTCILRSPTGRSKSARRALAGCAALFALAFVAAAFGCAQGNEDEDDGSSVIRVPLLVVRDDLFEFGADDLIGFMDYVKQRGPVGSRVDAVLQIDRLASFAADGQDRAIDVRVYLRNPDASRDGFTPLDFVQDSNRRTFHINVPMVETVPAILNFRVLAYVYPDGQEPPGGEADDDLDDDADDDDTGGDDDTGDDDDDDAADDDDTSDDDDTDADDDDTGDDDDTDADDDDADDFARFEAAADFLFVVNVGAPGVGD